MDSISHLWDQSQLGQVDRGNQQSRPIIPLSNLSGQSMVPSRQHLSLPGPERFSPGLISRGNISFDTTGSASTTLSPPSFRNILAHTPNPRRQRTIGPTDPVIDELSHRPLEQEEIDLLTYYRYQIAPRLDLGVGDSYFSVRALHRAEHVPTLYQSILALSSLSYRAGNGTTINDYASHAKQTMLLADEEDRSTATILLAVRDIILTPPRYWQVRLATLQRNPSLTYSRLLEGHWHVMARLTLAAHLAGSPLSEPVDLSFIFQGATPVLPGQLLTHKQQLRQSFSNLARALTVSSNELNKARNTRRLPFTAAWQSCWSDNQLWYAARNEEMQQILEMENFETSPAKGPGAPFPIVIFSNTCALVATLVHHLTALYLLHNKPRLTRPVAEIGSSNSAVWHAQRVVGIVAAFMEAEILDPFVVAAVLYAAKRLSHASQLAVVVNILRRASQSTGIPLQDEINNLETTHHTTDVS
ncbi:uncharacterized protein Z518_07842 [Rhinocladiella mackenziei CBS 650.93]|uniref:Rhinocladiella mackenziei CBS 650.93 unplaced genomic scaffold supercont1.6, whole genome shotgun sequence n=1 Tax=Rhinocladiella mackenziei CBS 650.93 TaxID=1442369 RepID=A0A0D2GUB7_9EURO|nr:uncharacterized protein Z518_07842 [Rhinocladiella mackenziei CBS 650.93]KIX01903.1 hypothetical protein Z518_07842 [Rhinocladiella mackenziei CBS 650.93]